MGSDKSTSWIDCHYQSTGLIRFNLELAMFGSAGVSMLQTGGLRNWLVGNLWAG